MSTKIHKVLGYGIKDDVDKRLLFDEIFENSKPGEVAELLDAAIAEARAAKREGYHSFAFESSVGFERENRPYPREFHDVVHYADHPDGDGGWWVITPPMQWKSWYRLDDTIDYYDTYDLNDKAGNQLDTVVKELGVPLYPYLNWMNRNTGEILRNYSRIIDGPDPDIVPFVPEAVRIIAGKLGMPDWKLFRPVLIRWWC